MATRTIANGGGNYNVAGTWVEGVIPTSADDVVATATSGPLTIPAAAAAKSLDFTNYTNTLTINHTIQVSGNCTLSSGMTTATTSGTPVLEFITSATLVSNGVILNAGLKLGVGLIYTLSDNWTIAGNLFTGGGGTATVNGNILKINGFTANNSIAGTTHVTFYGTGSWSATGSLRTSNVTVDSTAILTLVGTCNFGTGTFTAAAGCSVTTTGSTFTLVSTCTVNASVITFAAVNSSAGTHTFSSDLYCSSLTQANTALNGSVIHVSGNYSKTSGNTSGTSIITIEATSTIIASTGNCNNPFVINTAGDVTFSGTCNFQNNFTHTASNSILGSGTPVLNFLLGTPTVTLNQALIFPGKISSSVSVSFLGTSGFTCQTFTCTTANRTFTFKNGNTYTVSNGLTLAGTQSQKINFVSSTPTSSYNFVLSSGASCDVSFVSSTDADSSAGRVIHDRKGTLLRTVNWYVTNPDFFPLF